MFVYKILRTAEWAELEAAGQSQGAPIDLQDGYVHLSSGEQVAETAAKHFAGVDGLMLLTLEAAALGPELRWEASRGGALFPHLYRELRRTDVHNVAELPLDAASGRHRFPAL
ncbi:MAG: DUF952 domain-containing protein [Planctomycetota bacterium]